MADSLLMQLAASDRNPAQETQYQQLLQQAGIPFTVTNGRTNVQGFGVGGNGTGDQARSFFSGGGGGGGGATTDPVAQQQAINAAIVQENQPAIATLQGQQSSLKDAYSQLLQSVLGQGTVASNYAIRGENTLLGQRGITDNTSPLFQQQIAQALLPVQAQNQAAVGSVGLGSAQDINQLAASIASLQAGNPTAALSGATNLAGIQEALQAAQIGSAQALSVANAKPYVALNPGQALGNQVTGNIAYPTFVQPSTTTAPTTTVPTTSTVQANLAGQPNNRITFLA